MKIYVKVLLLLFFFCKSYQVIFKCIPRDYGHEGTVCVCNETYCDTVEPLKINSQDEYNLYSSSKSGLRLENVKKKFTNKFAKKAFRIRVDPGIRYQKIYGFGGAFTDAACLNIYTLSSGARTNLIASYFSSDGIEYNMGRVPIGGTDFSTRKYSLDDTPHDDELNKFKLSPEDLKFKIPVIKEAMNLSKTPILLMGAAWSAPSWMKTNNKLNGFGFLKFKYYDLWSKYHIRFLEEYEEFGINFWALSTGNEPTAGLLPFYPFNCLGWTPLFQSKWVAENLGPQLRNSKYKDTVILAIDDQRFTLPWWPKIFFRDNRTDHYVQGIALHWYWDKLFPVQALDKTHEIFTDKFILSTEACYTKQRGLPAALLGSWERGEGYASNIINNINHHVGGWVDWNIALDLKGGPNWVKNVADSPVIVNATAGEFYKQPMYYALGHFSKFVSRGSVRIKVKHSVSFSIELVGFLTPENNIVIVILNKSKAANRINVIGPSRRIADFVVLGNSIVTLIYKNTV